MSFDANVLRAMLRMARRNRDAEVDAIWARVGGRPAEVQRSMRRLQAGGLVEVRNGRAARLTMSGLAVAVAMLPARESRTEARANRSRAA